ncbi:DUF2808 domain-containing protein [Pyrococcus abyssi]|uniref:Uncharacterized protein n=1 Tax=Pyrococcus abyssi (strain GE5 / Orsay) TaxID=272844 RepID=Q8J2W7_PYRAB|nr:DUF2808 domain-containing protein [Pyrococcus abyssi]CAD55684.1 Hypothetical protein PAB1406 [Pyrococcus abyssi GE5]CCE70909.1 TPA: hypothetical protein PAB1406 [Pyrococcus abyssi GE5]
MKKVLSLFLALFVLAAAMPRAMSTSAPTFPTKLITFQQSNNEALPNINFITAPTLSNDTAGATDVELTLYFNNSLLDLSGGGQGLIKIGFTGVDKFDVTQVSLVSFEINGANKMNNVVGFVRYQQDPTDPQVQSIFIYVNIPIQPSDKVKIVLGGLKNPETPGTYTVSIGTYVGGNLRSSGTARVVIKGPKPPLTLPKPFLIGWHELTSDCPGCNPDDHYDITSTELVGYRKDGPIYEISYPLEYTLDCEQSTFSYNVYAWNLSYQNLTFKGLKIFVNNELKYWLPAEYFRTYKECVQISDGEIQEGVTDDFREKVPEGEKDYLQGWTLVGFEHAEPADMVVYYNRGYGWALTTYPTGYNIDNNSYIMTDPMPLLDATSADVKKYNGKVFGWFNYSLALDENVSVYFQYRVYNGVSWSGWKTIRKFTNADDTSLGYDSWEINVANAVKVQFRFFVNYTKVNKFTKPGFALFEFHVYNQERCDPDIVYVVNPLDNKNTTLFVYNLSIPLQEEIKEGKNITIELEAVYELTDQEMLKRYDPIQVTSQDFTVKRIPCTEYTLCEILQNARYIVEGGGDWAFGSSKPYYGWEFDDNNKPRIVTGHGSLAADNLGVLFYLSQAGADPNKVIFDDNPQYVNLTTGEIKGLQPGDIVILVGSSSVNLPLGYYEYVTKEAPVVRIPPQNGKWDAFVLPNGTVVEWAGPDEQWYDVWEDVFVIQWFTTEDGVLVFSVEGAGVDGTVAASWLTAVLAYYAGDRPLPPSGYIVGRWYEDIAEGYLGNVEVFAPAWIRGSPDDVNGFSTGDDYIVIEYMSPEVEKTFGDVLRKYLRTFELPSCYCGGE